MSWTCCKTHGKSSTIAHISEPLSLALTALIYQDRAMMTIYSPAEPPLPKVAHVSLAGTFLFSAVLEGSAIRHDG